MTNRFDAFPEPTIGGYRIMIRFPKDGKPKPVLSSHERPQIVQTKAEAWEECTRHMLKWMNGNYRSEFMGGDCLAPDDYFPSLQPIRRNGRVIPVTTNKRVRA